MKKHKKVTYTLNRDIINMIDRGSFIETIPKSTYLSLCIQSGYEMMLEDYNDNDKKPLVGVARKRKGTIPKTFTLPIDVADTLSWFSHKLDVKKSHLVRCCILDFEKKESEKLSQQIEELMGEAAKIK